MTIFDDQVEPTIDLSTILSHPLAVWYENTLSGLGNGIVSRQYNVEMGCVCGENSWEGCVKNPAYSESYHRFVERNIHEEVWTHRLTWFNPELEVVQEKFSRAKWISDHEILGEVTEWAIVDPLPDYAWLVYRILLFAAGVGTGYVGGVLWPITL